MVSKKQIRRLRLRPGDILVVKDHLTMEELSHLRMPEGFPKVPIIFAPNGIHRVSQKYLRKLVNTDSEKISAPTTDVTSTK